MGDEKVTLFSVEAIDCVGMIHRKVNHRDIGEICDQNISHHSSTYIRVAPHVRHLNTTKGLDAFCRHFRITGASPSVAPITRDVLSPRALKRREKKSGRPKFRNHQNTTRCGNARKRCPPIALTGRAPSVRTPPPFRQHNHDERNQS